MESMKVLLLLVACCVAAFTGSFLLFRSAQAASHSSPAHSTSTSSRQGSANEVSPSAPRSSARPERHFRDKGTETLLVPPALVDSIEIAAFDALDGGFTPDFKVLLDLDDQELAATKEAFESYFKAFTQMELTLATVVSTEERPGDRPGEDRLRRFATIRIDPAGDRLASELQAMREHLVDRLGKPRGLAATAIINHQLGNGGKFG